MQLYASRYIHLPYINICLDSLLEGLQDFPTLKQVVSLEIGLQCTISDYNRGHIIRELCTQVHDINSDVKERTWLISRL